ncbi:MAG: Smr/MutS family protein [Steroidobacteraceae bacterium]|nr:Smr/MutS family protein [Steroidobacteraceae bacterium]
MKDDERELFRAAVRGVKPLSRQAPLPHRERRRPRAASRRADEARVLAESLELDAADLEVETGEELGWRRPGVPESVLRRLRRGHYARRDELDLHGLTQAEARTALGQFLAESLAHGFHCVRIVHGKGLGSGHRGPVLKAAVNRWLRRHDAVRAFTSARRSDGGTGALYVLLSR